MKFDEMNPAPPVTKTRFGTRGSVTVGGRPRFRTPAHESRPYGLAT
jgi:hypothetical protein